MNVDNISTNGSLDIDAFPKVILQYRNTPDTDNKVSPSKIVFGGALRYFAPISS